MELIVLVFTAVIITILLSNSFNVPREPTVVIVERTEGRETPNSGCLLLLAILIILILIALLDMPATTTRLS